MIVIFIEKSTYIVYIIFEDIHYL